MKKTVWLNNAVGYNIYRVWSMFNRKIMKHSIPVDLPARKGLINREDFNNFVYKNLVGGGYPFLVARFGSTEATMLYMLLGEECGVFKRINNKYFNNLQTLSGFFPNDSSLLDRWFELMKVTSKQVDVLCYWETGYQKYLVNELCSQDVILTELDNLQPFFAKHPWTAALKGKRVLVVHPFAKTIEKQYKRRKEIWENEEILPEFTLMTVKAVQTVAGNSDPRFQNWFEALDWMYEEGMKLDFDIAVVACGAYGMPLAAKFKQAGKQAIHWGGMSQIWFGIKGGRWDNNPRINKFYNDAWVRPDASETPTQKNSVEGGCYW